MVKIGPAFGDYIKLEKSQRHPGSSGKNYSIRSYLMPLILIVVGCLILARLFFLQIIQGSAYRNLSDSNRTRTVPIHAPRGIIFDRNGVPLVFNTPGFREVPGGTSLGKTKLIGKDEALKLISEGKTNLEIDSLRNYPYKEAASHVLGYIGQISQEELLQSEFVGYKGGDLIGKMGIEGKYESLLKGTNGKELVEVNSMGKVIRKLGRTDPVSGQNIVLTLDIALQKAVFDTVKDVKKGAVIVSNPKGEILALVSKPSFDPNLFTMGSAMRNSQSLITQILNDSENQPFLNRAIGGTYPPGSTFKLITAAAGLEDKVIDKNFEVEDTGVFNVGGSSFANWYYTQYGKKEESLNVVKAIKRSNDIFFYKLAEKVGVNKLSQFAEKFGLGKKLGIDLEGERSGVVPTQEWKKEVIGENWYLGDTYHYGIGQGYLLTTPLQVNIWTQAIANGGILYQPHLLLNTKYSILNTKFLSKETVSLIKEGMIESCSTGGVAWPLFNFKNQKSKIKNGEGEIKIACKTGTAQHGGEETLPHAWITLFTPSDNPQIIVTVLAEESGEGSNIAAPIAKKILEEWFSR